MTQPTLFETPPPAKPLSDRQQFALTLLQECGPAGTDPDVIGAGWCAHRGKHPADTRCDWCAASGRDVLRALRRLGHARSRRDGIWYALNSRPETAPSADGDPFPEGF